MKLILSVALPLSLWATWAAFRGPPPPASITTPEAQPRPVSAAALAMQQEVAAELTQQIQAARARTGQSIPRENLEGHADDGTPHLSTPVPDNPLMPGIATIHSSCVEGDVTTRTDWIYCPTTGVIIANTDTQSVYGNE